MKSLIRTAVALILATRFSAAGAGETIGQVTQLLTFDYPNTPPLLFVNIGTGPGPASCGSTTSGQNRWVTRADTPAGKSHMLAIIVAQQTGRPVRILGKGFAGSGWPNGCDLWGDTESIHAVFLNE